MAKFQVTITAVIYADTQGHALSLIESRIRLDGNNGPNPAYIVDAKVQAAKDGQ